MKNKLLICLFAAFVLSLFSNFATAQDVVTKYYFKTSQLSESDITSLKLTESLDYWYTDSTYTTKATALPDFTNKNVELYIEQSSKAAKKTFIFDTEVSVKHIDYKAESFVLTTTDNGSISTESMYLLGYNTTIGGIYNDFTAQSQTNTNHTKLYVAGNLSLEGAHLGISDGRRGYIQKAVIGGNLNLSSNGTNFSKTYVAGDANSSINNPDLHIKGNLNAYVSRAGYDTQQLVFSGSGVKATLTSYAWINGFTGCAGISWHSNTDSTAKFYVVMTNNKQNEISTGSLGVAYNDNVDLRFAPGTASVSYTMRSSLYDENNNITSYTNFSQSFTGGTMFFKGGVTMVSGGLYMNYNALKSNETHGDLTLSKASGAEAATFGNSNTDTSGTFVFTDLVVADGGGSIRVRIDTDGTNFTYDVLTFEGSAKGNGVVIIALRDMLGNDTFDSGFLYDLIADSKENGKKLIAWSTFASDGITFTTDVDKIISRDGKDYEFTAYNAADGLYISYLEVIPEASTFAICFGVIALVFVAYRRRK